MMNEFLGGIAIGVFAFLAGLILGVLDERARHSAADQVAAEATKDARIERRISTIEAHCAVDGVRVDGEVSK